MGASKILRQDGPLKEHCLGHKAYEVGAHPRGTSRFVTYVHAVPNPTSPHFRRPLTKGDVRARVTLARRRIGLENQFDLGRHFCMTHKTRGRNIHRRSSLFGKHPHLLARRWKHRVHGHRAKKMSEGTGDPPRVQDWFVAVALLPRLECPRISVASVAPVGRRVHRSESSKQIIPDISSALNGHRLVRGEPRRLTHNLPNISSTVNGHELTPRRM